jgi:transcriptional regulator with XRE-family HTH domain
VQFNEYLKSCRTQNNLTQEALVQALYIYNTEYFSGLDTTTLSKWERAITQPKLLKQVQIIKYFQELTTMALPCFGEKNQEEIETQLCQVGMMNIIKGSKSKELILDFPSAMMSIDNLKVYQLKKFNLIDKVIKINTYLDKDFNSDYSQLTDADFKKWALMSGNFFLVCEIGDEVIGLLFSLKLKPEAFKRIINGEMMEKELKDADFALEDEEGSNYMLSFFSLNKKAASILFIRYYAYLIAQQKYIKEVGIATFLEDGQRLIESLSLPYYTSCMVQKGMELQFYKASLADFLATPQVIKMILTKQTCEEE